MQLFRLQLANGASLLLEGCTESPWPLVPCRCPTVLVNIPLSLSVWLCLQREALKYYFAKCILRSEGFRVLWGWFQFVFIYNPITLRLLSTGPRLFWTNQRNYLHEIVDQYLALISTIRGPIPVISLAKIFSLQLTSPFWIRICYVRQMFFKFHFCTHGTHLLISC